MVSQVIKLYENRDDVTLTTYVLDNSPEMLNGKKRPAILICPGGAYLNCTDREGEPIALAFAKMGYHTFVLRYSVYGGGMEFWPDGKTSLEAKEQCAYPAPMREIGQAMLMIKEHAAEWYIDQNRVGICGFSAGAHNCAMYATNWHKPIITDWFKKEAELFRPAVCILGYTISDYVYMNEANKKKIIENPMSAALYEAMDIAYFATKAVSEEKRIEASPARNVSEFTPPMFLWATTQDELVPVQQSVIMSEALADAKIPFEMHIFEEGPHGLATCDQASAASLSQTNEAAAKWLGLVETWLKKRFALEIPKFTQREEMMMQRSSF